MTKDGVAARTNGSDMSRSGLKKKFRTHGDDEKMKGKPTQKKGK